MKKELKQSFRYSVALAMFIFLFCISSSAGQWISSGSDWYYMTDDGNYAKDVWLWLDENHDGKAEFYHFNDNGIMSKSTLVDIVPYIIDTDYYDYIDSLYGDHMTPYYMDREVVISLNENGVATELLEEGNHSYQNIHNSYQIESVDMPPCSIRLDNNGEYVYSVKDGLDHYDFKEVKEAYIYSLTNYGDYYSADIDLLINHWGSDPGIFGILEKHISAKAYFSKDCKVKCYDYDFEKRISIDQLIPISEFNYTNQNFLNVDETDANGYITLCSIWSAE